MASSKSSFICCMLLVIVTTMTLFGSCRAMSLNSLSPLGPLGALDSLFPFFESETPGDNQEVIVPCYEEDLRLMCDTCPQHLPRCTLDLLECMWDCHPDNPPSSSAAAAGAGGGAETNVRH